MKHLDTRHTVTPDEAEALRTRLTELCGDAIERTAGRRRLRARFGAASPIISA